MSHGKTLKLFLIDGEVGGRVKGSLANWTGVAYKIPRIDVDKCKDIPMLNQSGVYFLFGRDEEDNDLVYIGQAGSRKNGQGLLLRVQEPHSTIDDWSEVIMFTTSNNTFGPTEISYLENKFCNLAIKSGRYIVQNSNDPNLGNVTEETEAELEEFIDYARIVMGSLGHKVFEADAKVDAKDNQPMMYLEYKKLKATGKRVKDGFVVFKGSRISDTLTTACPGSVKKARKKYAKLIGDDFVLKGNVRLSSPSLAAGFVGGASLSGNVLWKDKNGISLKDVEENKQD